MQSILPRLESARLNLVETAELFSEADYSFKLTPAQRTVAGWFEHTIEMNFGSCASLHSTPGPDPLKYKGVTSKAELVSGLKASFDYCAEGFKSMTDEKAAAPRKVGKRDVYPVNTMIGLLINWNEHYGNLVGYMRTRGFVPPTTARAQKAKK